MLGKLPWNKDSSSSVIVFKCCVSKYFLRYTGTTASQSVFKICGVPCNCSQLLVIPCNGLRSFEMKNSIISILKSLYITDRSVDAHFF